MSKPKKEKAKIYERNPNTGVIRWRYINESPAKIEWPNYGRILKQTKTKKVSSGVK
tara:strand:+ start:1573 stop:1740 length:168 start_codon:yes stop_codon:yes gene_type:complete